MNLNINKKEILKETDENKNEENKIKIEEEMPKMSNEQILAEANKWKAVFFPKQTLSKKLSEMEKAGEPGIKELLEEFPEFLPQMVGGC